LDDSRLECADQGWPAMVERPCERDEQRAGRRRKRGDGEQDLSLRVRYPREALLHERPERRGDGQLVAGPEMDPRLAQRASLLEREERVSARDLVDPPEQRAGQRFSQVRLDEAAHRRQIEWAGPYPREP